MLSAYAEKLLAKKATAAAPAPPAFDPSAWIGTSEAARLTGYSKRSIRRLCEEGFWVEGRDWKQRPAKTGEDRGGWIRIARAALSRLDGGSAA